MATAISIKSPTNNRSISSSFQLIFSALVLTALAITTRTTTAFSPVPSHNGVSNRGRTTSRQATHLFGATTVEPPTRERTDRQTDRSIEYNDLDDDDDEFDEDDYDDLEYLMDPNANRGMEDPFHILLLGSTFEKPKVTVPYVRTTLEYVISMPSSEAVEQAKFAKDEGLSCLGTWPREECLVLGRQLQMRDLVCRVVPYCQGGQRGWQAKDVSGSSNSNSRSDSFS